MFAPGTAQDTLGNAISDELLKTLEYEDRMKFVLEYSKSSYLR